MAAAPRCSRRRDSPNDYDGIIAGAPAFRFQEFVPWTVGVHRMQTEKSSDAGGLAGDGRCIPRGLRCLGRCRGRCDQRSAVYVRATSIDVGALCSAKTANQTEGCLTAGQIETARSVYGDVARTPTGTYCRPGCRPAPRPRGTGDSGCFPNEAFGGESVLAGVGEILTLTMRHTPDFDVESFRPRHGPGGDRRCHVAHGRRHVRLE